MLLKATIIGLGAAGSKACIDLMNAYPELSNKIMLVNTTMKDIPLEYRDRAVELVSNYKGSGKERSKANKIMLENLKGGAFDYPYDEDDAMAIIVTSSEGGTGSGSSTMLANYINSVYKIPVHIYIFTGFEDDGRSLKNTVDLFGELKDSYTVHSISNAKFLPLVNGNRIKAEKEANKKFVDDICIMLGGYINDSEQNIDESDLLKLDNTPGYTCIEHISLDKLKNVDDYTNRIISAFDESKNLIVEPTCKRLGVILNISKKSEDFIDYSNKILKERYGTPFESFLHIQNVHEKEYVQIIASGLKMPIEDINEIYENFIKSSNNVDKTKDEFFTTHYDTQADEFDNLKKNKAIDFDSAKANFFNDSNKESKLKPNKIDEF